MKHSAKAMTLTGLAGATAFAGATQSYATIVSVTPPTNITGTASTTTSIKEFWDVDTGTTSAARATGSDVEFGYFNGATSGGGYEFFTGFYGLNGGKSAAYITSSGSGYAYSLAQGTRIGTGGPNTFGQTAGRFTFMSFTYNGTAYGLNDGSQNPNQIEYVGFQFKAADGLIHDGWVELESETYASTSPGGLIFLGAAYNTVPDASGGYINSGLLTGGTAVPEPGTLAALAMGAAGLAGVGLKRRRKTALAAAQA